jgi:drug/metabolite transporter (DMT)-like permease
MGWHFPYNVRAALPNFLLLGVTTYAGLFCGNLALDRMSPLLIALIDVSLYPVFTSVIAHWFAHGEDIHFKVVVPTLGLAILGISLFNTNPPAEQHIYLSAAGLFWELCSITGWAASIVIITNLLRRQVPVLDVVALRFVLTILVLGGSILAAGKNVATPYPLGIGVFYFISLWISFTGLRKLSVITFAVYSMLSPIITYGLSGLIWGHWELTLIQIMGAVLIFAALIYRTLTEQYIKEMAVLPNT